MSTNEHESVKTVSRVGKNDVRHRFVQALRGEKGDRLSCPLLKASHAVFRFRCIMSGARHYEAVCLAFEDDQAFAVHGINC